MFRLSVFPGNSSSGKRWCCFLNPSHYYRQGDSEGWFGSGPLFKPQQPPCQTLTLYIIRDKRGPGAERGKESWNKTSSWTPRKRFRGRQRASLLLGKIAVMTGRPNVVAKKCLEKESVANLLQQLNYPGRALWSYERQCMHCLCSS